MNTKQHSKHDIDKQDKQETQSERANHKNEQMIMDTSEDEAEEHRVTNHT